MSGGRSEAGTVVEERRTEVFTVPAPPAPPPSSNWVPPPPPPGWVPPPQSVHGSSVHGGGTEIIQETKIVDVHRSPSPAMSHRSHHHHHHENPIILNAGPGPREETTYVKNEYIERSDPVPIGPLALALPAERHRVTSERSIRAEIKALEAEKEALKAQKRADRELRRADRYRGERVSETDLVVYDRERYDTVGEEVTTLVRRERIEEPEGGVKIVKDKKGRMSISVPKYI